MKKDALESHADTLVGKTEQKKNEVAAHTGMAGTEPCLFNKVLVWTTSVMAAKKETSAISTYKEDWRKETVQAGGTCRAPFLVDLTLLGVVLGVDDSAMPCSA